jgi:hypothetical protein
VYVKKNSSTLFGQYTEKLPETQNIKFLNYNLNLIMTRQINIKIASHGRIVLPIRTIIWKCTLQPIETY